MIIHSNFKFTDFEIVDFYGTQTCFAWQENRIVTFPFNEVEGRSKNPQIQITIEEAIEVKSIHSYSGRVFIICKPSGIWKLSREFQPVRLSKTGVGLGAAFREVLTPKDDWLCLDDKAEKSSTPLFRLTDPHLSILLLEAESTISQLRKILSPQNPNSDLCIVANGRSLLKLSQRKAQIIHACDSDIIGIVAIKRGLENSGFALLTNTQSVILAYPSEDNLLIFKSIFFKINISLTSAFLQNPLDNEIFIVFAGKERVKCAKLKNGFNDIDDGSVISKSEIVSIKSHKDKLFGLSSERELSELSVEMAVKPEEKKEFYRLNPEMLKGTEVIMDSICERAKELKSVNEELLIHQDKLNRVNIYAHKQQIPYIPKMKIDRTAGRLYLRVIFETCLPQNSQIVVNLKSEGQQAFSSKLVQGSTTTLEVPLKEEMIDLDISFHLITHPFEAHPWCIIKNCLQEPPKSLEKKNTNELNNKKNFLNAKLSALKKYIEEDTVDMKKLSNIKNILREKFPN